MPTIEDMSPFPGTPGDTITANGVDLGIATQIVLTYTSPGSSTDPGGGVTVQSLAATLTRINQTQVTFTMPDFGLTVNKAITAKALYTQDATQHYTNLFNYETGPAIVTPPPATPPPVVYGYDIPAGPMAYPIGRVPWVFTDPYDTDSATNTYNLPLNPNKMTTLFGDRAITIATTTAIDGQVLLYEGMMKPVAWQFSGAIFDAQEYDKFRSWVYERRRRIIVTDHYGRDITCIMTKFDAQPVRANGKYWRHDYTISATVLAVGRPTRIPA